MNSPIHQLDFLKSKLALIAKNVDPSIAKELELMLDRVAHDLASIPRGGLRSLDGEFDKLLLGHLSASEITFIRQELKRRFGFTSLGSSPDERLAKISKAGKVVNESDAKIVQDHLAGDYHGYTMSDDMRIKFEAMLQDYETHR